MTKNSIETKLVQLGNQSDPRTGAVNPPIYLSTAYKHTGIGESTGYDYIRTKNPTREILENGIAELEGGDAGFACSSGMAAIQLILSIFKPGDEIILPEDVYGGTYRLLKSYNELYNIRPVYFSNAEQVEELINEKTKAIFLETPTNPLMIEFDLDYFNQICKKHNLIFIVDNTFYSPYFQRPIEHGADIVMHSGTKYIAGHNDTLAGLVVSKGKELSEKLAYNQNSMGLVLSPFDSWLVIRGLKTLHLRMKQHDENAKRVVNYLKEEPL